MEVKQAETRRTEGKRVEGKTIFAMSSSAVPVCRAGSYETVTFVTKDCFDNQFTEEGDVLDSLNWDCINPATGAVSRWNSSGAAKRQTSSSTPPIQRRANKTRSIIFRLLCGLFFVPDIRVPQNFYYIIFSLL